MNPIAFVLLVLAIVLFVLEYKPAPHRSYIPAGLALFAGSLLCQFCIETVHRVSLHWT